MISFENTEIAFKIKNDRELRKAHYLFKAISSPSLVRLGSILSNFAITTGVPINWIVKPTIYSHFCGGETIEECLPVVRKLAKHNVKSILDYSVEGKEKDDVIEEALEETLRTIENAAANREMIPFTVFKPTAFGREEILEKSSTGEILTEEENKEAEKFVNRVRRLFGKAAELDVPIMIDAEDSYFQKFIDEITLSFMEKYNRKRAIVYNTYQMYRRDRLEKLEQDYRAAREKNFIIGAKFVRGAYMEKERERAERVGYPSPIHPDKEHTDRDYNAALKYTVERIDRFAIFNGTHNEESSRYLVELMEEHNIAKNDPRCYFSQLYGMSDHISFNLAHNGLNVAKYLPYGPVKTVIPYLIRRTEENTSVAGQTSREMMLISREWKRRKKSARK